MAEPRFKIGDFVVHKGIAEAVRLFPASPASEWLAPHKPMVFLIVGILADQCYAGTQVHYVVRGASATGMANECVTILEIELDPAPTQPLTPKE